MRTRLEILAELGERAILCIAAGEPRDGIADAVGERRKKRVELVERIFYRLCRERGERAAFFYRSCLETARGFHQKDFEIEIGGRPQIVR